MPLSKLNKIQRRRNRIWLLWRSISWGSRRTLTRSRGSEITRWTTSQRSRRGATLTSSSLRMTRAAQGPSSEAMSTSWRSQKRRLISPLNFLKVQPKSQRKRWAKYLRVRMDRSLRVSHPSMARLSAWPRASQKTLRWTPRSLTSTSPRKVAWSRGTGLRITSLSSATIASNSVTFPRTVQTRPRRWLVSSVDQTNMSPSTVQRRCASNATRLAIKPETAQRPTSSDARNATT